MTSNRVNSAVADGRIPKSPWIKIFWGVLSILFVCFLDILTGKEISFSIFYLPPVAYTAWALGFHFAVGAAVLSGVCWHIADIVAGNVYSSPVIPVWNAIMRTLVFIIVSLILSKLKQAHEQERAARQIATEATRAKSDFLANMSHEIRTPINAMIGAADILSETSLNTEQTEYVEMLRSEGEQVRRLLNDVLDYSKLEAQRIQLEETSFSLRELVTNSCQGLERRSREKGLPLTWSVAPTLHDARLGDPYRLRQVLTILLSNAVKFTEKGKVTLEVGPGASKQIRFSVQDTGIGIPKAEHESLFGRFSQANASVTRRYGGTGLGLSIAKGLVERMGGQIGFTSVEAQGTTFFFEIPIAERRIPPATESLEDPNVRPVAQVRQLDRPCRVLLVDDYEFNRRIISRFLKHPVLQIDLAENGKRGFDKILAGDYDLILLDMHMPEMDGWTVAREVRKWERDRNRTTPLPIIALTASALKEDEERCLAAGCTSFLGKPIRKQDLLSEVERILRVDLAKPPGAPTKDDLPEIDPEIAVLIPGFLEEVSGRCELLIQNSQLSDFTAAAGTAHQLVGLGGTYGFGKVTEAARLIEDAAVKEEAHEIARLAALLQSYVSNVRKTYG